MRPQSLSRPKLALIWLRGPKMPSKVGVTIVNSIMFIEKNLRTPLNVFAVSLINIYAFIRTVGLCLNIYTWDQRVGLRSGDGWESSQHYWQRYPLGIAMPCGCNHSYRIFLLWGGKNLLDTICSNCNMLHVSKLFLFLHYPHPMLLMQGFSITR